MNWNKSNATAGNTHKVHLEALKCTLSAYVWLYLYRRFLSLYSHISVLISVTRHYRYVLMNFVSLKLLFMHWCVLGSADAKGVRLRNVGALQWAN